MAGMGDDDGGIAKVIENFKPRMWQPDLVLDVGNLRFPRRHRHRLSTSNQILRMGPVKPRQLEIILNLKLKA